MSSLKKKILFTGIELVLLYLKIKLEERQDNIQNNRYHREIAEWVRNHENTQKTKERNKENRMFK